MGRGRLRACGSYVRDHREAEVGIPVPIAALCWEDSGVSLWLFALDPSWIALLWIRRDTWLASIASSPELADRWSSRLRLIDQLKDVPSVEMAFTRGSITFLSSWIPFLRMPTVSLIEGRPRTMRKIPGTWCAVSHSSVGGVSTQSTLFGLSGSTRDILIPPTVPRVLHHIIKFSEPVEPARSEASYRMTSWKERISLNHLMMPIHYKTHLSPSGWGSRLLTVDERRQIFDIPSWVGNPNAIFSHGTPLKALMAVAQVLFRSLGRRRPGPPVYVPPTRPPPTVPAAEWLPGPKAWLPAEWCDVQMAAKACRGDEAEIELAPWRRRVCLPFRVSLTEGQWCALDEFVMRYYFRCLFRSWRLYLQHEHGKDYLSRWRASDGIRAPKRRKHGGISSRSTDSTHRLTDLCRDISVGRQVLTQNFGIFWESSAHRTAMLTEGKWPRPSPSSWDWTLGSAQNFWRGSDVEQRRTARDGMPAFVLSTLPASRGEIRPQIQSKLKPFVYKKLYKVLRRKYLVPGQISHCMSYFPVPKGPDDIRMVYDGSRGGVNDAQWAPSFYLPDIAAVTWFLDFDSFMFDLDYGECFLNFRQSPELRRHSGVSLRPFGAELRRDFPEMMKGVSGDLWVLWDRAFMGGKLSPYIAIRQIHWMEEAACGDPTEESNPFRYDKVILNLPGSDDFDPSRASVIKWNDRTNSVACGVVTYSDDARGAGPSANWAFLARDRLAKSIQYKGAQDAARKASFPSKTPPAWIGGQIQVTPDRIQVSVPQEKWDKMRGILSFYRAELEACGHDRPSLNYKVLEKKLGFLSHIALTYKDFRPFLRGFYLTLNSWRTGFVDWTENDEQCVPDLEDLAYAHMEESEGASPTPEVIAAARFAADVRALSMLTEKNEPTLRNVRFREARVLVYAFTDASGTGGGASFVKAHQAQNLTYRVSVWTAEEQEESSNWREFTKVVEAVEDEASRGELGDSLVFLFTDNSTVEAAIHSGSSKSQRLHSLVVQFLALQMTYNFSIEVYHVAGTRMIAQGTDGISRGALNEGILDGHSMTSFIPLHLSALERSPALKEWLTTWVPAEPVFLTPYDWFQRGHGIVGFLPDFEGRPTPRFAASSVLIWTPPPYAADVAIAELRKAVHKRPTHTHVFVCPRLCLPKWRRHFYRACDTVLEIPAGSPGWPTPMFEPLLIGLVFPFLRHPPWQLRGTPRIPTPKFHVAGKSEGLLEGDEELEDRLESGFTNGPDESDAFMAAREGDDLMCQFECDYCVFKKLYLRPVDPSSPSDDLAMACIRRILLDAFWCKRPSTVQNNAGLVRRCIKMSNELSMPLAGFEEPGPLPLYDHCGYGVALMVVYDSLKPGRHSSSHKQWDTVRRIRTAYANQRRAAATANSSHVAMADREGKEYRRLSEDPCAALWFANWSAGCSRRMGQDWRPDLAVDPDLLKHLLRVVENFVEKAEDESEVIQWTLAGGYFLVCYVCSLRSTEGLLLDVEGLRDHASRSDDYVIFALRGRVKGESHSRQHLLPCVNVTASKLDVRQWHSRIMNILDFQGRYRGPVFVGSDSRQNTTRAMNSRFHTCLIECWTQDPRLFPGVISCEADILERYDVFRSFRRGSSSRAMAQNVSKSDRYVVNRWKSREAARGSRPAMAIDQHYLCMEQSLPIFLRYTSQL